MRLVLSDIDALNYWRRASAPGGFSSFVGHTNFTPADMVDLSLPKRRMNITVDPPTRDVIDELRSRGILTEESAHILVTDRNARRQFRGLSCGLMSHPMPAKSLYPVYSHGQKLDGIFTCSPMLALLQLAKSSEFIENVLFGLEVCGTFRLLGDRVSYGCSPLISAREYKSFVNRHEDIPGIAKLRAASKWIADGSASPIEASLITALALPLARGGYGLGMPKLNRTLRLGLESARLLGYPTITPDAIWEHHEGPGTPCVPLEYDSGSFHNSKERLESDQRRRNTYASLGMNVVVVRPEHLRNYLKLDAIADTLRRNIGLRKQREPKGYSTKHYALLSKLFPHRQGTSQGIPFVATEDQYGYVQSPAESRCPYADSKLYIEKDGYPDWGAS